MPGKQKDGPKRVSLDSFKEMRRNEAGIEVEAGGDVFVIDPPDLWPDDMAGKVKSDEDYIRFVMGDQADGFIAAGGTGRLINALMEKYEHLPVPESSASSES